MKMYTPADEPLTSEVITQALAMLALWGPVLSRALAISFRDSTSLANLTQDLALALVEAQEAEQEEQSNPGPADGLFYTLDQVKAHAAAAASMADVDAIFPVEGMDDD
jgi:phage tail protein X